MNSSVKEALRAILGNVPEVRAYHLPDDFNALWTMQSRKSPLIIVWDETPSDLDLAPIDCRSVLSPFDWAIAYVSNLTQEDPWPRILILDLQPESNRNAPLYLRFNEMRPTLLPWLQILLAPDISMIDIVDFINAAPHKIESRHREAHRALMHQASFTLTAGASEQETGIDRHAVANIIGPSLLSDPADTALVDLASLHQVALVQALRAHKLISDCDVHNVPAEAVVGSLADITLHLVDDQARHGWYAWVKATSSRLLPGSIVRLWENPNKFLDAIENAVSSLDERPNADLRFRLNFSSSGNDILLLDLRLFSGRSENDEAEFFLRVIDLCKFLNRRAKKCESLSPPFDQDDLKEAEEWCYEASDKGRTRKDRRYFNALTLLPRLIAQLDMSLPIVIFSSSTIASVFKAFQSHENIFTDFAKPSHFTVAVVDVRNIAHRQFARALNRAFSFLSVRNWLRSVAASPLISDDIVYGIPEGAIIELYLDESGDSTGTRFAVGGHLLVYPSADAVQALANQLTTKKLVWGIDDANNGVTKGNLFKIPENDRRANQGHYDQSVEQLQEIFDDLHIRIAAIGLQRGYAMRTLMPPGIAGLDPTLSDSAFWDMLSDTIESAIFGLLRRVAQKDMIVNVYAATKLGHVPEKLKSAAEKKHGLKFAYVYGGEAKFYSLDSQTFLPIVSRILESHPQTELKFKMEEVKACALSDFDTLVNDQFSRPELYHRRISGQTGAFPRQIHYLADWLARFCLMDAEKVPKMAKLWFSHGFLQRHNTACFRFLEAVRAADAGDFVEALRAAKDSIDFETAKPSRASIARLLTSNIPGWADRLDGKSLRRICEIFSDEHDSKSTRQPTGRTL